MPEVYTYSHTYTDIYGAAYHTPQTDDEKAKDCDRMMKILGEIRLPFEPMIDNIITYVNHSRRKIIDTPDTMKGQKTGIEVYDGTALQAKNLLVDGMCGYMVSRELRWFGLGIPGKFNFPRTSGMRGWSGKPMDEYPEVKEWLENVEEVMYAAFARSNFYDVITEFIGDGATTGTAHIFSEEDVGRGRIVFTVPHFRECFIAENQYGTVDTNYRVYRLTLKQLAEKFGLEKMKELDPNFEKSWLSNPHAEKEIIHGVFPRKDRDSKKENGKNRPVASLWVMRQPLKLIEENGYYSMPSITWRWRKNSDEWYGRSPAWDAFVDIMLANQMGRTNLVGAHKMVEPPMVGPSDLRGVVNTGPAGWTWMDLTSQGLDKIAPRPLVTGIQLPYAVEAQKRMQEIIKEHFHVNFFLMLYQAAFNKVDLTATQVLGMQGEQAAVLGTRVGRLQSEALDPNVDRTFEIELRAGRIPMPPSILIDHQGHRIQIEYLGPLSQAQKRLTRSRSIRAGLESAVAIAQAFPGSADIIDSDETMKEALESAGFPPRCIRTDDEIKKIRAIKMKQMEQQQKLEQMGEMSKIAQRTSRAVEKGSPIDLLTGGKKEGEEEGAKA